MHKKDNFEFNDIKHIIAIYYIGNYEAYEKGGKSKNYEINLFKPFNEFNQEQININRVKLTETVRNYVVEHNDEEETEEKNETNLIAEKNNFQNVLENNLFQNNFIINGLKTWFLEIDKSNFKNNEKNILYIILISCNLLYKNSYQKMINEIKYFVKNNNIMANNSFKWNEFLDYCENNLSYKIIAKTEYNKWSAIFNVFSNLNGEKEKN